MSTPILMDEESMRGIISGLKTQTRRLARPPAPFTITDDLLHLWAMGEISTPFGERGSELWVRETWNLFRGYSDSEGYLDDWDIWEEKIPKQIPVSDNTRKWSVWYRADPVWDNYDETDFRWRPAIHMPRWASRYMLINKGEVCHPISEITEEEALADGGWEYKDCPIHKNPIRSYRERWDSLYAKPRPIREKKVIVGYESFPWESGSYTTEHRGLPHYVYGNPHVLGLTFEAVK